MSDYQFVIETDNITKIYPKKIAVNKVSIHVKRGEIYGLIGKNGAGKTTLMKMLLGLSLPTSGSFTITGEYGEAPKIGSLIEDPGLYKNCTAEENLKRFSILSGADIERIPSLLETVGLKDVGKKKVKAFSLGMKQRLGIAVALLNDPDVLILDEPINGLDPAGIKDIRDIISKLHDERNVTFIISSHILDELAKVATTYGIINNGVLVEELSAKEIEAKSRQRLIVNTDDNEKAASVISSVYPDITIEKSGESLVVDVSSKMSADVAKLLIDNGLMIYSIAPSSDNFENFFIERLG